MTSFPPGSRRVAQRLAPAGFLAALLASGMMLQAEEDFEKAKTQSEILLEVQGASLPSVNWTVIQVSPHATDPNARVLNDAVTTAKANLAAGIPTRIVLSPGIYRDGDMTLLASQLGGQTRSTPLLVEGSAGGASIITGSRVSRLSDWTLIGTASAGGRVYRRAVTRNFSLFDGPWQSNNPTAVIAHRVEMASAAGIPLRQLHLENYQYVPLPPGTPSGNGSHTHLGSLDPLAVLKPWSFGVTDKLSTNYVYICVPSDVDPAIEVEVSHYQTFIEIRDKQNVFFRNLVVADYASRIDYGALMIEDRTTVGPTDKSNVLIENCSFVWNNANGLWLKYLHGVTLRNVRSEYNGFGGMNSSVCYDWLVEHAKFNFNGWRAGWADMGAWAHGGAKVVRTFSAVFRNIEANGNNVPGLWFDIDNRNIVVDGVSVIANRPFGMFFEISPGPFYVEDATVAATRSLLNVRCDDVRIAEALSVSLNRLDVLAVDSFSTNINLKVGTRSPVGSTVPLLFGVARPNISFNQANQLTLIESNILRFGGGGFPLVGSDGSHGSLYQQTLQSGYIGQTNRFFSSVNTDKMFNILPDLDTQSSSYPSNARRGFSDWLSYTGEESSSAFQDARAEIADPRARAFLPAAAHPGNDAVYFLDELRSFIAYGAPDETRATQDTAFIPDFEILPESSGLLIYDGFVAGDSHAEGEYTAAGGSGTNYRLSSGQNPVRAGFASSWTTRYNAAVYGVDGPGGSSLVYPGVTSTGNKVHRLSNTVQWNNSSRPFDLSPTSPLAAFRSSDGTAIGAAGTTLYASFLVKIDHTANPMGVAFGTSSPADVSGTPNTAAFETGYGLADQFLFKRATSTGGEMTVSPNTGVNLVVVKFEFTGDKTGTYTYYLNPTDLSVEANNVPVGRSDVRSISFNHVYITTEDPSISGAGGSGNTYFDEFRLSTKWGDGLFKATEPGAVPSGNLMAYDGFTAGTDPTAGQYTATAGGGNNYRLANGQNPVLAGFSSTWSSRYNLAVYGVEGPTGSSLAYPGVTSTGNKVHRLSSTIAWNNAARSFDLSPSGKLGAFLSEDGTTLGAAGKTIYASFLVKIDHTANPMGVAFGNSNPADVSGTPNVAAFETGYGSADQFLFKFATPSGGEVTVAPNTGVNLVVVKFEFTSDKTGTYTYYLNPSDLVVESNNPPLGISNVRNISFRYVYITTEDPSISAAGGSGNTYFDELRLADQWGPALFSRTTP